MSHGVRDVDKGYRDLVRRVYGLRAPKIRVGIIDGEATYKDGATVLEVAIWNEFGTATIPERSFIRGWFDENQDRCRQSIRIMLEGVLAGKWDRDRGLNGIALRFVAEIKKRMSAGIPPPVALSTFLAKGSDKPLIDTGQLRSSITYKVEG